MNDLTTVEGILAEVERQKDPSVTCELRATAVLSQLAADIREANKPEPRFTVELDSSNHAHIMDLQTEKCCDGRLVASSRFVSQAIRIAELLNQAEANDE